MNSVPLYVINNFLRFERKVYQLFGLQLGRPIRLKSIFYFLLFGALELLWYFAPVIGKVIHWVPPGILLATPVTLAWLLSDIGTENRSPAAYFRSFLCFHWRKMQRETYFQGRKLKRPRTYALSGFYVKGKHEKKHKKNKEAVYQMKGYGTYQ